MVLFSFITHLLCVDIKRRSTNAMDPYAVLGISGDATDEQVILYLFTMFVY